MIIQSIGVSLPAESFRRFVSGPMAPPADLFRSLQFVESGGVRRVGIEILDEAIRGRDVGRDGDPLKKVGGAVEVVGVTRPADEVEG